MGGSSASALTIPLSREAGEGDKGGEGKKARLPVHACAGKNSPCRSDSVPNRCTLISSCRFPPLREGNRVGVQITPPLREGNCARVRFPLLAGGTLRRGSKSPLYFTSFVVRLVLGVRHSAGHARQVARQRVGVYLAIALKRLAWDLAVAMIPLCVPVGEVDVDAVLMARVARKG